MPFQSGEKNPKSNATLKRKRDEKKYSLIAGLIFVTIFIVSCILAYGYRTSFDAVLNDVLRAVIFFGVGAILSISIGSIIYAAHKKSD